MWIFALVTTLGLCAVRFGDPGVWRRKGSDIGYATVLAALALKLASIIHMWSLAGTDLPGTISHGIFAGLLAFGAVSWTYDKVRRIDDE